MKSFFQRYRVYWLAFPILILVWCSKNQSTQPGGDEIVYLPQYYSIYPEQSDTISYFGSLVLVFDHRLITDTLILKIEKINSAFTMPEEWSSSLITFQTTLFNQDSSLYPDFSIPVDIHFISAKIQKNLNSYQLGLALTGQDQVSLLQTLIDRRFKSVWSRVNGLTGTYSMGLLKQIADSLKNGVSLSLPVTYNGLPALPNYSFPEDVPLFYCYDLYSINSPNDIKTPVYLPKYSGIHLPSIILSFSTHNQSKNMENVWIDAAVRTAHIRLIVDKLEEFGSNNFDGISLDYFHVITEERVQGYLEFMDEFSLQFTQTFSGKKLIFSLPYLYLDNLVTINFWDRIDHLNIQIAPFQPEEKGLNTLAALYYEKIEEKIFALQSKVPFRKLYWEVNPLVFVTTPDSVQAHHPSLLLESLGLSFNRNTIMEDDSLWLSSELLHSINSYTSSACMLKWLKSKLQFSFQQGTNTITYFTNTLSLDYLIDFCQRMNFGGIHLVYLEKEDKWELTDRLRDYFYNRFYPLGFLSKKNYQVTAKTRQKVYDSLWVSKDSLTQDVIIYSEQDYGYKVVSGMTRKDSLRLVLSYSFSSTYTISDTFKIMNTNGKPYFDYTPRYSISSHSVLMDTVTCVDPDGDSLGIKVLDPINSASINSSDWILRWKPDGVQQAGDFVDFHLVVSDSLSSRDMEFRLLLTEQNEKDIELGNGKIVQVVSPEMIYLSTEKIYAGNDTAYQIVKWDTSYTNQIRVLKPIAAEFLVYTRFLKDDSSYVTKKLNLQDSAFYQDTSAYSAADVIFQGLKTSYSSQEESPIEVMYSGNFFASIYELSNQEYVNFVLDSGYFRQEYWSPEGWQAKTQANWTAPMEWTSGSFYTTSSSPLPEGPVVGVSYYEAQAYSLWLSQKLQADYRLPTEYEWERMAVGPAYSDTLVQSDLVLSYPFRPYPWGQTFKLSNIVWASSDSVKAEANHSRLEGKSVDGICHLLGNALEWTSSYYNYPRSDQVNTKMVLRGGGFLFKDYTDIFHNKVRFRYGPEQRRKDSGFRLIRKL